jgi:hypothetical protein
MEHGTHHGKGQCGPHGGHHGGPHGGPHGGVHGGGGCCGGRAFLTKEEKIERLDEYREWLLSEAKGVEEAIEELKKE